MSENKIVVKIDPEIAELVPAFLQNRRTDIQDIQKALQLKDYPRIKRIGHIMKGAGAGYGFDAITELGMTIEEKADLGNEDAIRRATDQLGVYLDQVEVVYE